MNIKFASILLFIHWKKAFTGRFMTITNDDNNDINY